MNQFTRYVILLCQVPGFENTRELVHQHIQYLRSLAKNGNLELCGPFTDHAGGMIIIKASSKDEALALAAKDPFVTSGSRTFEVREWKLSCEENNHLGAG